MEVISRTIRITPTYGRGCLGVKTYLSELTVTLVKGEVCVWVLVFRIRSRNKWELALHGTIGHGGP